MQVPEQVLAARMPSGAKTENGEFLVVPPSTCSREAVVLEARCRADALADAHPIAAHVFRSFADDLMWGDVCKGSGGIGRGEAECRVTP